MKTIYYAIQNIIRGKDSTIIKVVSLSLGLFLSIILFSMVANEMSYNSFYQDNEDIYVAETAWDSGKGLEYKSYLCIYPTAQTLMEHFPEQVESATIINLYAPKSLQHGKENISVNLVQADSLYFLTMGIPLVEGNAKDLNIPDALFLSQSTARRIFGDENPIGKTLKWQNKHELIVKGIFTDVSYNVTLPCEAVLSFSHPWMKGVLRTDWTGGGDWPTFVRLKKGADMEYINQRINAIVANYLSAADAYKSGSVKGVEVSLTPLRGYNLQNERTKTQVIIVSILGLVLLLTAAFNYALISISSLSYRAKAIGVHKCNGAETGNIFGIFFWETFFVTGLSVLIAVFLILNLKKSIIQLTGIRMEELFAVSNLWLPALTIGILFIIGWLLPGRLFSSIPVTQVFRRYTEDKKRWKYPLLFVQFSGTAFLAGLVSVIYLQYHYVMTRDMGYNPDRVAFVLNMFENPANAMSNLRNLPYVEGSEFSMRNLVDAGGARSAKAINSKEGKKFNARHAQYSDDFCRLMGIRLLRGRYHTNNNEILVNPELVRMMGWTSDGMGEVIEGIGTVTGIIDITIPNEESFPYFASWIHDENMKGFPVEAHVRLKEPFDSNLIRLNEEMKKIYPTRTPVFRSYKEKLSSYFHTIRTFRDSVMVACIAILAITLMGVIGYTNDEVRRRSKEIAIRKVNGAEVGDILRMFCKDVAIIALPAVLIGTLASKYVGELWVSTNFKDILAISPLIYIGVAIVAMAFILGTVIVKSWRVANENPVLSIKSE